MTLPDGRGIHGERLHVEDSIQVAGIPDEETAKMLVSCGVDYLGFPFRLPIHQNDVGEEAAARIIGGLGPGVSAVLITYLDDAKEITSLCASLGVTIVQLHGTITRDELFRIRSIRPELRVIKSIIIEPDHRGDFKSEIDGVADLVDAFITDTFDPATGARGATGKTHDWHVSGEIVRYTKRPVILAGGLNPENVRTAIATVKPAGVDVHTGVEDSYGVKRRELVHAFVSEARDAFSALSKEGR